MLIKNKEGELRCEICHKYLKSLSTHISKTHRMDVYEYMKTYDIKFGTALVWKPLRDKISAAATKQHKQFTINRTTDSRWKNSKVPKYFKIIKDE